MAALQEVSYIPHFKLKFPTPNGVGEVKRDLDITKRCYRNTIEVEPFTEDNTEPLALLVEEMEDIELILGNKEKIVKIWRSPFIPN